MISLLGGLLWKEHQASTDKSEDKKDETEATPSLTVKRLRQDMASNETLQEAIRQAVCKDFSMDE